MPFPLAPLATRRAAARSQARAARTERARLRAELASFSTPAERAELAAVLSRSTSDERADLAAATGLRRWAA